MGSLNKVQVIGNLGRDAELRYTPGGAAVAKFSVAATETWNDKQGQRQERTEWFNVDVWGKTAEALAEYLRKGKQVYVEGRLQTDEYTDKEGIKRKSVKVRADHIVLLGGARSDGHRDDEGADDRGRRPNRQPRAAAPQELPSRDINEDLQDAAPAADEIPAQPLTDDDIPF